MTAYLLDANVLIYFESAGELPALLAAAAAARLVLVREVHDEVVNRKKGPPAKTLLTRSAVEVQSLPLRAVPVLASIRGGRSSSGPGTTTNLGEDASIALAIFDPDLIFVTGDREAAFHALNELRGRVMTMHVFLREIVGGGALPRPIADRVGTAIPHLPSWWATWQ